jgi:hypothetical protein
VAEATPASVAVSAQPAPNDARKQDEKASDRASHRTNRTLGWIAVAIGAEAAVAAVVTSGMMLHENDVRNRECTDKVCSPAGLDANNQLSNIGPWNAAAYVVGAVGLGAGIFLLVTNPAEKEGRTEVGVSPGGLTVRGAF